MSGDEAGHACDANGDPVRKGMSSTHLDLPLHRSSSRSASASGSLPGSRGSVHSSTAHTPRTALSRRSTRGRLSRSRAASRTSATLESCTTSPDAEGARERDPNALHVPPWGPASHAGGSRVASAKSSLLADAVEQRPLSPRRQREVRVMSEISSPRRMTAGAESLGGASLDSHTALNGVLKWFLAPFTREGEDVDEARRKTILIPPAVLMLAFFICFCIYEIVSFDRSGPIRLAITCGCLCVLLFFVVTIHRTKKLNKGLVGGCVALLLLSALGSDLANVGLYENWVLAMLLMNALLLSDPKPVLSWALFAVTMAWVVVRTVEDSMRFGLYSGIPYNDRKPPREAEGWGWGFPVMCLRIGVFGLDHALTRRFAYGMKREREKLQGAVRMGEQVATALVNFDLELAQDLVASAEDVAMRGSFLRLLENLRLYRPFLPAAVFSSTNDSAFEVIEGDTTPLHSPTNNPQPMPTSPPPILSDNDTDSCSSHRLDLFTKVLEENYDSILKQRMDVGMKLRKGSVVRCVFDPLQTDLLACFDIAAPFAEIVLEEVHVWGGIVVDLRGPTILSVWNTHVPCPRYCFHAVRCSQSISELLQDEACGIDFPFYTSAIAAGQIATGSTGLEWQRSHFVLGQPVTQAETMNALCRTLAVRQMMTERVHEATRTQVTARIVDVISDTPSPFREVRSSDLINVYEIMEGSYDPEGIQHYNNAFMALRSRNASKAVTLFGKCLRLSSKRNDIQAKRMMCIAFGGTIKNDFLPDPFARPLLGWRALESEAQKLAHVHAADAADVLSETDDDEDCDEVVAEDAEEPAANTADSESPASTPARKKRRTPSWFKFEPNNPTNPSTETILLSPSKPPTTPASAFCRTSSTPPPQIGEGVQGQGQGLLEDLRRMSIAKPPSTLRVVTSGYGMTRSIRGEGSPHSPKTATRRAQFTASGLSPAAGVSPKTSAFTSSLALTAASVEADASMRPERIESIPGTEDQDDDERDYVRDVDGSKWYRSEKLLGKGTFGDVWLGMGEDGALVAMKWLRATHFKARRASRMAMAIGRQDSMDRKLTTAEEEDAESGTSFGGNHYDSDTDSFEEDENWESDFKGADADSDVSGASINVEALLEVRKEVEILSQLKHDNIVCYLSLVVSRHFVVINMEYVPGGSLQHLLEQFGRLPMSSIRRYTKDIVRGLRYLHDMNVAHRDFKPGNVLVQIDGQCKLSDFGASAVLSEAVGKGVVGTLLYMAPEACRGEAEKAADIWSLAIALCQMITSSVPYDTALVEVHSFLYHLGRADAAYLPVIPDIPDEDALTLVRDCLQVSPDDRPTAEGLLLYGFLST